MRLTLPAVLFPAVILCGGCSRQPETVKANPEAPVTLRSVQVNPESVRRTVELVGTLEGKQEVTISSEVSAPVVAVRADLGDRVERGQALVELDATELKLAVERQRAALAQVVVQLGMSKDTDPIPEPGQTSIVRKAAADLGEAKTVYERTKALTAKGVLSPAVSDTAEARYRIAEANYAGAVEQAKNLQAQVANLRAQLALAEKKVADSIIRAPFSATVRSRLVEVGQYLREQTPVMSIASLNPLRFRASIPERWFPYVTVGDPVELSVEAYSDRFLGKVSRIGRAVDPQTRTFQVEAHVDNSRELLRPGLFARGVLTTAKIESVLRIPASAVISFYGVQKVYCIENGQIREQVVKLGDRMGNLIEVTEGLKAGDRIAVTELTRVRQGSRVTVQGES